MNHSQRQHRMCAANRLHARLRQTEVQHLAGGDEVFHSACHVLDGHLRVNPVLQQDINAIGPESAQLRFNHPLDVFGTAVQAAQALAGRLIDIHTEFRLNDDLAANPLERRANNIFRKERSVNFGGVYQRDAAIHGSSNECDSRLAVKRAVVEVGDRAGLDAGTPLTSQPDRANIKRAEFTPLTRAMLTGR